MFDLASEKKVFIAMLVVYFCLSWILTWTYFSTHDVFIPDSWAVWHEKLISGLGRGGSQMRIVTPLLAEVARRAFDQPVFAAYLIVRFFTTFLMLTLFHMFLLKWFKMERAFMAVVLLAAITPVTYLPYLQEADVLLQLVFLICLWLIRERRLPWLILLVFAGTLVKETIIFVVPFYAIYTWENKRRWRTVLETLGLVVAWAVAYGLLRATFPGIAAPSIWQLPHNLDVLKSYFQLNPLINIHLLWLPLLGIFWVLPFIQWRNKPFYFRRAAPYIVLFMILNFTAGWPEETRIILPIAFLVIPSGLMALFANEQPQLGTA